MSGVGRMGQVIELTVVPAEDEQADGQAKGLVATRETAGAAGQTGQVMPQLSIVAFNAVGLALVAQGPMATGIVDQGMVGVEIVTVVLSSLGAAVEHGLQLGVLALPDDIPTHDTAGRAVYGGEEVDASFFSPMKVNNSSNSTVSGAATVGAGGSWAA